MLQHFGTKKAQAQFLLYPTPLGRNPTIHIPESSYSVTVLFLDQYSLASNLFIHHLNRSNGFVKSNVRFKDPMLKLPALHKTGSFYLEAVELMLIPALYTDASKLKSILVACFSID